MSRKSSSHVSDKSEEVEDIHVQIEKAIKAIPVLADKLQIIAINGYMQQKIKLDDEQEKQMELIDVKYRKQVNPFLAQINEIIQGKRALTEDDFVGVNHLLSEQERVHKKEFMVASQLEDYWFKALEQSDCVSPQIKQKDIPILKHLYRIEANKSDDATKLSISFFFTENEWFKNGCLLKEFLLNDSEVEKTYGDAIDWKAGKNVTVKQVKKKQKNKKTGEKKVATKEIKQQSFFHFFKPIDLTEIDEDNQDEEVNQDIELAMTQYTIASELYESIVLRSLEAYLGVSLQQNQFVGKLEDIQEEDESQEDNKVKPTKQKNKRKESNKSKSNKSKSKSKSREAKDKPRQKQKSKDKDVKEDKETDKSTKPTKPTKPEKKDSTSEAMKEECKQQ